MEECESNASSSRLVNFNNFMKPKRSDRMERSETPNEKTRQEPSTDSKLKAIEIEGNNDSFSTVNVSISD